VNRAQLERQFGQFYAEMRRRALATRLPVGLHYLKYLYNVSDEVVVASWVENPYWQYFCGAEYFEHEFP
jgi:IS5 family transposase